MTWNFDTTSFLKAINIYRDSKVSESFIEEIVHLLSSKFFESLIQKRQTLILYFISRSTISKSETQSFFKNFRELSIKSLLMNIDDAKEISMILSFLISEKYFQIAKIMVDDLTFSDSKSFKIFVNEHIYENNLVRSKILEVWPSLPYTLTIKKFEKLNDRNERIEELLFSLKNNNKPSADTIKELSLLMFCKKNIDFRSNKLIIENNFPEIYVNIIRAEGFHKRFIYEILPIDWERIFENLEKGMKPLEYLYIVKESIEVVNKLKMNFDFIFVLENLQNIENLDNVYKTQVGILTIEILCTLNYIDRDIERIKRLKAIIINEITDIIRTIENQIDLSSFLFELKFPFEKPFLDYFVDNKNSYITIISEERVIQSVQNKFNGWYEGGRIKHFHFESSITRTIKNYLKTKKIFNNNDSTHYHLEKIIKPEVKEITNDNLCKFIKNEKIESKSILSYKFVKNSPYIKSIYNMIVFFFLVNILFYMAFHFLRHFAKSAFIGRDYELIAIGVLPPQLSDIANKNLMEYQKNKGDKRYNLEVIFSDKLKSKDIWIQLEIKCYKNMLKLGLVTEISNYSQGCKNFLFYAFSNPETKIDKIIKDAKKFDIYNNLLIDSIIYESIFINIFLKKRPYKNILNWRIFICFYFKIFGSLSRSLEMDNFEENLKDEELKMLYFVCFIDIFFLIPFYFYLLFHDYISCSKELGTIFKTLVHSLKNLLKTLFLFFFFLNIFVTIHLFWAQGNKENKNIYFLYFYVFRYYFASSIGDMKFDEIKGVDDVIMFSIIALALFLMIKLVILNLVIAILSKEYEMISSRGDAEYVISIYENCRKFSKSKEYMFIQLFPLATNSILTIPLFFFKPCIKRSTMKKINDFLCILFYCQFFLVAFIPYFIFNIMAIIILYLIHILDMIVMMILNIFRFKFKKVILNIFSIAVGLFFYAYHFISIDIPAFRRFMLSNK